LNIYNIWK